ncbi:MAG: DNA translocase FtsK [Anaerolineales bacterium]
MSRQDVPSPGWETSLLQILRRLARFASDFAALFLITLALLSLMAIHGWSQGILIKPWGTLLRDWLGWGSYLFILHLLVGGIYLLHPQRSFSWSRLFSAEIAFLLTIPLLSFLGGLSLARAEMGMDGGRLGWGLATLFTLFLPSWLAGVLVFFLWIGSVAAALGLSAPLEQRLRQWAEMPGGSGKGPEAAAPTPSAAAPSDLPPLLQKDKAPKTSAGGASPAHRPQPAGQQPPTEAQPPAPARRPDLPPLDLLLPDTFHRPDDRTINQTAGLIEKTLAEFGIPARVVGYRIGPTITQYAVQPGFIRKGNGEDEQQIKVRVAQIAALQRDLALALAAERLRIEAPVPGKPYVGIEVPNGRNSLVRLRSILQSEEFRRNRSPLTLALGRDVSGQPVLADLARLPHLLIAGTTGSGKSVCLTAIAACLAMNNAPQELRLILIDSKMVELIRFNGLPHLYGKVETQIERILAALRWTVTEMENRYRLLESAHARDLQSYNQRLVRQKQPPVPRIVVLIDELADLMMAAAEQVEHNLVRLAQMARATGIHLVVATQRPSTDVITGLIKANFPARIAFAVASGVDSRVILDSPGAETLLGRGDMLFLNPEIGAPIRAQGVFVSDAEIDRLLTHWQKVAPQAATSAPWEHLLAEEDEEEDNLIEEAIRILRQTRRASASLLQRRLRIGYPRAARLLDELEARGIVSPAEGPGREREVLLDAEEEGP